MSANIENITILQGKTYKHAIYWEDETYTYKPITAITKGAPVVITSPAHGLTDGWPVVVVSAGGMTQINAENNPPKDKEYKQVTKVGVDTVSLNTVNSSWFSTYTSGGYLQFRTPHPLIGVTARMTIKDKVGGTILAESGGLTPLITMSVDDATKTIEFSMTATDTAAITWRRGVYEVEAVDGTTVYSLLSGSVAVIREIAT